MKVATTLSSLCDRRGMKPQRKEKKFEFDKVQQNSGNGNFILNLEKSYGGQQLSSG